MKRALKSEAGRKRIPILGIPVDAITMGEAVQLAEKFIADGSPHLIVTPNAEIIYRARRDEELAAVLKQAALVVPDGYGLIWASRRRRQPLPERVTGIDLMHNLLRLAAAKKYRVFLLGATPEVVAAAACNLQAAYRGIDLVGYEHGYFTAADEAGVLSRIKAARPQILLAGMGAPRQEKWLHWHYRRLGVPVNIGVGGSFDVVAGKLTRAPQWMRQAGLEWLYRLGKEPKRIRRMLALPLFAAAVLLSGVGDKEEDRNE